MDQESTWLFIYHAGETITIPADQLPGVDVWAIAQQYRDFVSGVGVAGTIALDIPGIATGTIELAKVTGMIVRPNGGDPSIKKVELLGAMEGCPCPCQNPEQHYPEMPQPEPQPEQPPQA